MTVSRDDVESVLDYLESAGLVRLGRVTGKWHQLYCPFHNNGQERKPSCGCSLDDEVRNGITYHAGQFNCFVCGSRTFSKGLAEILKLKGTSVSAHPFLDKYINNVESDPSVEHLVPNDIYSQAIGMFAKESDLSAVYSSDSKYVTEEELASYRFTVPYMYERKLTDEIIDKYDVGYDANFIPPGRKKCLPCITFPVRDVTGHTLFFCRRSIQGKFFNYPEGVEKPVYGVYELPKNCKEIIICESVFNALTAVVYGHPAVALLGTGNSSQISQLKRLGAASFVLCLDNDDAGRKGTAKLKKALQSVAFVWTMHMPDDGRDLNDLSYDEFIESYNNKD